MTNYARERLKLENNLRLVLGRPVRLHSPEILLLDPKRLKREYYRRAHEFHPDKAATSGLDPEYLTLRFRSVCEAYAGVLDSLNSGAFAALVREAPTAGKADRETRMHSDRGDGPHFGKRANPGQWANPGHQASARVFHSGRMPGSPLRLGQYLYYGRDIDLHTLIRSLSWQLRARPKLGDLGIQLGYLSQDDILGILRGKGGNELFGEAAVRLGLLTPAKLSVLAGRQLLLNLPIGRFYVDNGYLDESVLTSRLESLKRHNFYARTVCRRS